MRPQGTEFADSARARDSVMCLGSIAALQYYFARTGLLEGKGAQMAKDLKLLKEAAANANGDDSGAEDGESTAEMMEPPAVSTYRHKDLNTEPLPQTPVLRRQLREALDHAVKVLADCVYEDKYKSGEMINTAMLSQEQVPKESYPTQDTFSQEVRVNKGTQPEQRWEEAQGLHILDVVTLSIRQARVYYITHDHPQALYAVQPERQIRSDLYYVLDILKRMAARDFRGGIRSDERSGILSWIQGIHHLVSEEEKQDAEEAARRHSWPWLDGNWDGREREREWLFLNSFDLDPDPLPEWKPAVSQPSEFLLALSKGLRLISLHNEMIRRSRRPFGTITTFYTDLAKPYRCAENLRYWAKAAELRWEIKLNFDALEVVHGESEQAWLLFDTAVQTWCKGVREELTQEWADVGNHLHGDKTATAL